MATARNLAAVLAFTAALLPAQTRPPITGVAHYAIFVADVDKARTFYKDFLGYGEPFDLKNPDGSLSLTFIKINDRQYIEIFPEKAPNTDRLNHISIETPDAEALRLYLQSKGVKVPDKVNTNRIGNRSFSIPDPDGHGVEITQYTPEGASRRERSKFLPDGRISTRMAHVGIIVGQLDASLKFYRDLLGFEEIWRGSSNGKTLSWSNLKVPNGDDYIELMLYADMPEPTKRGSQHHICLFVPDIEKARETLQLRAPKVGYTRPMEINTGVNRKRQVNLFDPDGTRVELMEPGTIDGKVTPPSTAPPPH